MRCLLVEVLLKYLWKSETEERERGRERERNKEREREGRRRRKRRVELVLARFSPTRVEGFVIGPSFLVSDWSFNSHTHTLSLSPIGPLTRKEEKEEGKKQNLCALHQAWWQVHWYRLVGRPVSHSKNIDGKVRQDAVGLHQK
jgi:hypothetical protein